MATIRGNRWTVALASRLRMRRPIMHDENAPIRAIDDICGRRAKHMIPTTRPSNRRSRPARSRIF